MPYVPPPGLTARILTGFAALVAMLMVLAAGSGASAFDVKKVEGSVFKIYTWRFNAKKGMGSGTGFLVSGRRTLVTNYHVIAEGEKFFIGYLDGRDGKLVEARVVERRASIDLAVLEAYDDLPGRALPIGDYEPEKLASVVAVGFPGAADVKADPTVRSLPELYQAMREPSGFDPTITPGMVSRIYLATNTSLGESQIINARTVQHNAPINPGNSGGPLFDACGAVIGVNSFFPKGAQGVFFSIQSAEVTRFLRELKISHSTVSQPCLTASLSSGGGLLIPALVAVSAALALAALVFAIRNGRPIQAVGKYVSNFTRVRRPAEPKSDSARVPAPAMNWTNSGSAICLQSQSDGRNHVLPAGKPQAVGRGRQSEIVIDNDTVSTNHARVHFDPQTQRLAVTDLGSSNGTFLNGSRISSGQMQIGDALRFGTAEFRLVVGQAPVAAAVGWMLSGFDPTGRPLQFELLVAANHGAGDASTSWTIGRDGGRAQFVIDDASVSGAHAQITYEPRTGLTLRDLGSTNGTRVDGEALGTRVVALGDTGQEIAFGAAKLRLSRLHA